MINQGTNIFSFLFYNEETKQEKEYRFNIHAETPEQIQMLKLIDQCEDDEFNKLVYDMEGNSWVYDEFKRKEDFYVFTSYEVEIDKCEELMKKFHHFFLKRGYNISDVD